LALPPSGIFIPSGRTGISKSTHSSELIAASSKAAPLNSAFDLLDTSYIYYQGLD